MCNRITNTGKKFSKISFIFNIPFSGVVVKNCKVYIEVLLFVVCFSQQVLSQSADSINNISIASAGRSYEFIKGNETHPVLVSATLATTYNCNGFRTFVPFVEEYDEYTSIDNVSVYVNGHPSKSIKPLNSYLPVEDVFYSDAHICYFGLPLEKKNSQSQVIVNKTINDPRYFTTIYFDEDYYIENEEVSIKVPKWMKAEIKEYNFPSEGITKKTEQNGDAVIYTYILQNRPARKQLEDAPGESYTDPHLLILSQSAQPPGMQNVTYFQTLQDLYNWYHSLVQQVNNDVSSLKPVVQELTKNEVSDTEKIETVFQWVQANIRYIAFEDGMAAYKPEEAQEVYRKKYGDCKGMANLTKEMLAALGYDARLCWLGTNHIAYTYSTPSIAVDNHMICAVKLNGKFIFLDATEKYIGIGEYAERIEGRQVLIEDGDNYILETIPKASYTQNAITKKSILKIDSLDISGSISLNAKGESKEYFHFGMKSVASDKRQVTLQEFLSGDNTNCKVQDIHVAGLQDWNKDISIDYTVEYKNAVSEFGNEKYISVGQGNDFSGFNIDTLRDQDFWFPFKYQLIDTTELIIPGEYTAEQLPKPVNINNDNYRFNLQYHFSGNKITFTREMIISASIVKKADFRSWNKDITTLNNFYKEQIVLKKS
jgi:transglutaminase-like putative cysteine protease